ncbi:hypothetical protein V1498_08845 [Peribacillus sp. SCS-26]
MLRDKKGRFHPAIPTIYPRFTII